MPAGIETFGDQPSATVTSGGTTTSDTSFNVTPNDSWPGASSSVTPNTFFRIVDQANTSEIMLVTTAAGGAGAQTWTVARGQEGTTAIAHAANWVAVQVLTAGTFQNLKQASNAATAAVTLGNSTTETIIASYTPVPVDIEAGATFEAIAFGTYGNVGATRPVLTWRLRWGGLTGTVLAQLVTGTNAPAFGATTAATGSSFDINGTVTLLSSTTATANLNLWYTGATLAATALSATTTNSSAGTSSSSTPVTISGSGPLVLTAQWGTAATGNTLTATAPLVYRAA